MAGNAAADFNRGRRIAKYEILTRLSVGGMAELFLAYLPGPGGFKKFVALKQILPDVKADDAFVKMFLDEARITAAFNHSNIGQVFDLGEDENSEELYLAMEFIAGQNLEQVIKRAAKREVPIPVGFAARVVRDACLGLHYAHTFKDPTGNPMAVVHRDVSPKNVMVTYTGQVKMIDFGIAKAKGRLNRTQIGIVKGTSGYMSPEQVRNEPLDGRTDLFAAGVMLHEMLTGERLFTANTDAAMMIKIVDEDAKDPTLVNEAVSPDFAQVVLKMLAKDRAQRFGNGKDVARAIEQACPEMFDDEQLAEVMGQLFEDKIALTRSLLEMADDDAKDEASLSQAVQGLTTGEEAEARARKTDARNRATATPPRPPPRSAASSQRLPKVATRSQPPPAPRPGSNPQRTQVRSPSRAVLPPVEDDVEHEATIPPRAPSPRASQMKLKPVEVDEGAATPPRAKKTDARPAPQPKAAPEEKKKGGGGVIAVLLLLILVGGGGWAVTKGPLKDQAQAVLKAQVEEPVVDTSAKPVDPTTAAAGKPKPAWLVEKEKQDAQIAAEKARQKEIEDAANDPEVKRQAEEAQAQLDQITKLEEEQRQLKAEAKTSKANGEANSKKIDSLQKQIDDLKNLLNKKMGGSATATTTPGSRPTAPAKPKEKELPADGLKAEDVAVVKDTNSARRNDVGYVSITTINPTSAAFLLGTTELGSSPLVKAPLDIGHHQLKVVDGDGKVHLLSVDIKGGATLTMTRIDVGTLPPFPGP